MQECSQQKRKLYFSSYLCGAQQQSNREFKLIFTLCICSIFLNINLCITKFWANSSDNKLFDDKSKGPHGSGITEVYNVVKCSGGATPFISQVSREVKRGLATHTHTETHTHCECFIKLHLSSQMCLHKPRRGGGEWDRDEDQWDCGSSAYLRDKMETLQGDENRNRKTEGGREMGRRQWVEQKVKEGERQRGKDTNK